MLVKFIFSDGRENIGFIPLCFSMAHLNQICEEHQHGLTSVEILGVGPQHSAG